MLFGSYSQLLLSSLNADVKMPACDRRRLESDDSEAYFRTVVHVIVTNISKAGILLVTRGTHDKCSK